MLMTMSSSSAPCARASWASNALVAGVLAPSGNPITAATLTPLPRSRSLAKAIQQGFTQTAANR